MENPIAEKTILVTGGTGSIGSEISKRILENGARKVIVFSRDDTKQFMLKRMISDDRLHTVIGDIKDLVSIRRVFNNFNIDIIYHVAALKHVTISENSPVEAVKTNIIGTQNIVDLANEYKIAKVINISTDKASYPVNVMGASKLIAERIVLNASLYCSDNQSFSCIRFGNVANSRGSVIPVLVNDLLNHRVLRITDPMVTRFIIRYSDAVELILKATKYTQGGEIFILKMRSFRLGDLQKVMVDRISPRLKIPQDKLKIETTGLEIGEKLHEDLINITESSRIYELDDMYVVLPDNTAYTKYKNIRKLSLSKYTSADVDLLSSDDLYQLVVEYLNSLDIFQ